jgi:hypothetical protein
VCDARSRYESRPGLTLERPQHAYLATCEWVRAIESNLRTPNHEQAGLKINVRPLERNELADPESVAITDQNQRLIPDRMPVPARRSYHRLDFALVQPVARGLASDFCTLKLVEAWAKSRKLLRFLLVSIRLTWQN